MTPLTNPRLAAYQLLLTFEHPRPAVLDERVDAVLNQAPWSPADKGLFFDLLYGTLRQWPRLSAIIAQRSRFPLEKQDPRAKTLLRLGLYQLLFFNAPHAAVHTTIELAKQVGLSSKSTGFMNAVLRGVQREPVPLPPPAWPEWIAKQLPPDAPADMPELLLSPPPLTIRVNPKVVSPEAYQVQLVEAEVACHPTDRPDVLVIDADMLPTALPGFASGAYAIQDRSSAEVAHWVNPQPGETVLDLCAGLGSKTAHLAARMPDPTLLTAIEPHAGRFDRLLHNLTRLQLSGVQTVQTLAEDYTGPPADHVLVDAPCSALGTARRHPEIVLHLSPKQLKSLTRLQAQLLARGWELLKPGGTLIYSTCSILAVENQQQVQAFLAQHPNAELLRQEQRWITPEADGFYLASLRKSND